MSTEAAPGAPSPGMRKGGDAEGGSGTAGLVRLTLRRHRATAWAALGTLVALLVGLVFLRAAIVDHVRTHRLDTRCVADWGCGFSSEAANAFRDAFGDPLHYTGRLIEFLPLVIGLFVAGPMIGREMESGTYKLAWTQSVSPARWLAVRLAVPAVAVLAGLSLLSAAYTWTWRAVPVGTLPEEWWSRSYDMLGVVPVAHALLAVAVGALVGLAVKRTLAAMGGTLVTYSALVWGLQSLRPRLTGTVTELSAEMPGLIKGEGDAWIVERGLIARSGGRIPEPDCGVGVEPARCAEQHGATGWYLDYHPSSHLWTLQWTEAGIAVALAALTAAASVWLIRRTYP
ncbi:hypothetical protein [Streptomyces griseocarneus]|uniref:hypothetical protein n=1 Tax=Streptomyces griseocarneus TaxID=51201 RepID=UPI00167E7951|nr:hypothetical protein [Streptomyces griseocarneus]MBZ6473710.1 ABC transporter permease [Streptomyces griseocarneus]GHG64681.1 hypothetical protein GCM10018779_34780 [Streptomyces griseocarneus]